MAKSGMNPKTLQYLMGHSDIGVTLNTYTHLGLEDAQDEGKVSLLLSHAGMSGSIADPWYTGNFNDTYRDVLLGCKALFNEIVSK